MNDIDLAYLAILCVGVFSAYHFGKKEGIGITLDYMREIGKIDYED